MNQSLKEIANTLDQAQSFSPKEVAILKERANTPKEKIILKGNQEQVSNPLMQKIFS